jgi:hypothetical protein
MPLHCDTLQDALKNNSTVLVTLFLRHVPEFHKKYDSIAYIGAS